MKWLKNNAFWIATPILTAYLWLAYYESSKDASLKGAFEGGFFLYLAFPLTTIFVIALITAIIRKYGSQ